MTEETVKEQADDVFTEHWTKLWQAIWPDPKDMLAFQLKLGQSWSKWGMSPVPTLENLPFDKRFSDESWNEPTFQFLKFQYFQMKALIEKTFQEFPEWDARKKQKIEFFMRQYLNAVAPSNFFWSNPEVINETIARKGDNLIRGFEHVVSDWRRNPELPQITMTDLSAYGVGENLACTPGQVVFQNDLFELIQYTPQTEEVFQTPLLIVPPWINKYYILDLSPRNSWVNWLVQQGHTVFMISWVNPEAAHRNTDFEDYALQGLLKAIDAIQHRLAVQEVNAVGFCIGGTLLGSTLAYCAAKKQSPIRSATYLATMLDFAKPGDLGLFIGEESIQQLECIMAPKGYLDGRIMAFIFNLLRENDLIWSYYVNNYLKGKEPVSFDLLYWNSDPTNLPEKMHRFYLRNFYYRNLLREPGGICFDGVPLDLRQIKNPVYFISTEQDHIAPWDSTYQGALLHGGQVTFVLGGSGHIAGIVNPPYKNKYGYRVLSSDGQCETDPMKALAGSEKVPGSWWEHWQQWIQPYVGQRVPTRDPADGGEVLKKAPGDYVRRMLTV